MTEQSSSEVEVEHDDGFNDFIGPLYQTQVSDTEWDFWFTPEQRHLNGGGAVHGGMLMSFADHVLGKIVWEAVDQQPCVTMSLNCDFVAGGKVGEKIAGKAEITRKTRSVIFVKGELTQGGRTVMTASGIWKLVGK